MAQTVGRAIKLFLCAQPALCENTVTRQTNTAMSEAPRLGAATQLRGNGWAKWGACTSLRQAITTGATPHTPQSSTAPKTKKTC